MAGGAAVLPNPPWTQSGITAQTINRDGSGHGVASAINGSLEVLGFVNDRTFNADHYFRVQIISGLAVDFHYAVGVLRGAKDGSASSFQGYEINTDGTAGAAHTEFVKWVNGASSVLGNFSTTYTSGDIFEGWMVGTTFSLYKNSALVGTISDSTFSRAGAPGEGYFNGSGTPTVLLGDFEGENAVATVPPLQYNRTMPPLNQRAA
jgi:hypothetical protein